MNFLTHMMDWLPSLIWSLAVFVLCASCLRFRISGHRTWSVTFLGWKWPWKNEGKK